MNLTERELALIMVALDSASVSIGLEAVATEDERLHAQSYDMNKLWDRCHEERLHLLQSGLEERPPCPTCGFQPEHGDPAHLGYRCDCWQR